MLGRFLELSVWSRDIAASLGFWEPLGFRHGQVGETWKHRYAVLSDGRLVLGLHEYEFDSPSLTWVRPGLAETLPSFRALGIDFDFAKTGQDEFNEAGFRDPAGQVVTLLEARTWSPTYAAERPTAVLGHFREYRYPARDPAATVAFWEALGLVRDDSADGPRAVASELTLAPDTAVTGAELVFEHSDLEAVTARLNNLGCKTEPRLGSALRVRAPDGLTLVIEQA